MRNPLYGYLGWDQLQPGESMLVPVGYNNITVTARRHGIILTTTIKGAPEGYRIITRIR